MPFSVRNSRNQAELLDLFRSPWAEKRSGSNFRTFSH